MSITNASRTSSLCLVIAPPGRLIRQGFQYTGDTGWGHCPAFGALRSAKSGIGCVALLVALLATPCALLGQNLVVNPGFEEFTQCPNTLSQIDLAVGWERVFGTPDYFNACADDSVSVPFNAAGHQWPSDGAGYAGLGFYGELAKECLQGSLISPLDIGMPVYISMRVSPGGFGYADWSSPAYMASHIGLRFSTQPLDVQNQFASLETNAPVLFLPSILNDTAAWTVLSAVFIPDSAYAYLQIGNFFADSLCQWEVVDPLGLDGAYAFIDAVCVSREPGMCDPVNGMVEHMAGEVPSGISFHDLLEVPLATWGLGGTVARADLLDAHGRLVRSRGVEAQSTFQWHLTDLPDGLYVLEIVLRDRPSAHVRLLKH